MEIFETGNGKRFLSHKAKEEHKWWINNEDNIDVKYMLFDISTIKTGIGKWSKDGGYEWKWADIVGSKLLKPDEDWKNAFSVWAISDGEDEPMLWRRSSFGEYQGFLDMFRQCYKDMADNKDKVALFEYVKSVDLDVGYGSSKPVFLFKEWRERPAKFVIPAWDNNDATVAPVEREEEKKIDEIPF